VKKKPLYQRDFASIKSFEKVLGQIRGQYVLRPKPKLILQRRYFDTFDWRVYRSGHVFEVDSLSRHSHHTAAAAIELNSHTGSAGVVPTATAPFLGACEPAGRHRNHQTTKVDEESRPGSSACRLRLLGKRSWQRTIKLDQEPDFFWHIQDQDLRQYLEPIIAVRRLLLQAEILVSIEPFDVLDNNGKLVLRLELEKYLRPDRNGRYRSVLVNSRLNPLRGYSKVCRHMLELIDTQRGSSVEMDDPYLRMLSLENITPAEYSNKFNISFDSKIRIGQALAQTLLFHMGVIRKNLPGLQADLDSECLHDFRIANRRSRTLITQIKNVLPPEQQKYYRNIFSWLSNETCAHRDLDVFIHDIPHFMSMLPRGMREDLEPLRKELLKKRKKAHSRLLKILDSEKFLHFEAEYQPYLVGGLDNHFETVTGRQPVMEIANKSIWRVYLKLLKKGTYASATGDREALHELRKTGKKFRYLLETFRSLYPEKEIEQVLMHCRKLQNLLGRIVDYRVQQSYLQGLMGDTVRKGRLPASTYSCIKYLIDTYGKLEEKAYGKFQGRFARFSDAKTQNQFRTLFRD